MRDCAKINRRRRVLALLALTCLGDALADFKVAEVQPKLVQQSLVLAGQLDLGLNAKVEEAVAKGIPLEIAIEVNLYRARDFLWDRKIADWTLRRRIQYHALSGQYLVNTLPPEPETGESLLTLSEALKQLGTLNDVTLKLTEPAAPGTAHAVDLRVSLDIEALPAPLRPVAYTSFPWHLNSGWSTWKIAP